MPERKQKSLVIILAVLLTAAPIVVFWYVWNQYAVSIPKYDDHALKGFLLDLENETSLWGKILQFFRQHNEHRIVYDRFITWLDFSLWGKLSYVRLMVVGNLSLVGLMAIFGAVLRRTVPQSPTWLIYLPPVAFLLFNLCQWENMFWGMSALQNFTVVFWVFFSIYLLTYTDSIVFAGILATLATLTSGNGLLIWPIGLVVLLLQKQFTRIRVWGVNAIVIIILYFVSYEKLTGNPPVRNSISDLLKAWFAFNGAAAEAFFQRMTLTWCIVLGGIITLCCMSIGVWRLISIAKSAQSQRQQPNTQTDIFLLAGLAFILGTAAIVAWSRTGFGLDVLITSRYKVYSLLLLILVYLFAVTHSARRLRQITGLTGLIVSGLLAWLSYPAFLDETIWWRQWMLTRQFNWTYTTNRPISSIDPVTARWIDNAPAFYDQCLPTLFLPAYSDSAATLTVHKQNSQITINDSTEVAPNLTDPGTYLLLRSTKRLYLFQTQPTRNQSRLAQLGVKPIFLAGFSTQINEQELDPGTYRINKLRVSLPGHCFVQATNDTIIIRQSTHRDIQKNW